MLSAFASTLIAFAVPVHVDGDISEWSNAVFTVVTPDSGVVDSASAPFDASSPSADLSFRFAVASDDSALYVAIEATDDKIVTDSCEPGALSAPAWDDDAVEVFIDGNCNRAADSRADDGKELRFGGEFSLTANGAAMSDYSGYPKTFGKKWSAASNFKDVSIGKAGKMTYEFRLPWEVMGLESKPPAVGFTISVQDDDDGGRRDHALYWTGAAERPFSDESGFGTVKFQENGKAVEK